MEDDIRIQLTRIEGGVTLLNERLETVKNDIVLLWQGHERVSARIGALEMHKAQQEGRDKGIGLSVKAVQFLLGAGVMGLIATILRAFRI